MYCKQTLLREIQSNLFTIHEAVRVDLEELYCRLVSF